MEQKDVENPERFLQTEDTIPMEVQQILMNNPEMRTLIEGIKQQVEGEKQGIIPQNEQTNTIPDASIPEAQPME